MKYTPKPIEVDARQVTKLNGPLLAKWVQSVHGWSANYFTPSPNGAIALATTLTIWDPYPNNTHGQIAYEGDWVVRVDEDFYIYDYEKFHERFEKAK
jgi:hypothetical protein